MQKKEEKHALSVILETNCMGKLKLQLCGELREVIEVLASPKNNLSDCVLRDTNTKLNNKTGNMSHLPLYYIYEFLLKNTPTLIQ